MRKVHVYNRVWQYHIGISNVVIESPLGEKRIIPFDKLVGLKWQEIEKAQWKKYFIIKPSNIKNYIESHLSLGLF